MMTTRQLTLCGIAAALAVAGCGKRGAPEVPDKPMGPEPFANSPAPTREQQKLSKLSTAAVDDLAFRIAAKLADKPGKNLLVSPLSISICHTMLLAGATGQTRNQLSAALSLDRVPSAQIDQAMFATAYGAVRSEVRQLQLANACFLFGPAKPKPAFEDILRRYYDADVINLGKPDANSLAKIDDWAREKTAGMIPKVFDELNPGTVLVLADAACFIGKWKNEFDPQNTREDPFKRFDGKEIRVPTMHGSKWEFEYAEAGGLLALGLPYQGFDYKMVVLMPRDGDTRSLLKSLDVTKWTKILGLLAPTEGEVALPKFTFDANYDLIHVFGKLGVTKLFRPGAELGGACGVDSWVEQDLHITHIEVDERGTRAAAVTAAADKATAKSEPVDAKIDRPFLYAIVRQGTGLIVFLGVCDDPTQTM